MNEYYKEDTKERIIFDDELRKEIKETTEILVKAVKSTLGPSGTNVGTLSAILLPSIVNDGVTVANAVVKSFKDPLRKYIANVLKTVSQNTDNIAGDGTTTSLTLAEAIIINGLKHISVDFSALDIVRGINVATRDVLKELETKSIDVLSDKKLLLQVATISANNDKDLGKLISQAFTKVGANGQIEVEDSPSDKTYVEIVKGMKYLSGSESNMFVNSTRGTSEFKETNILIYEGKLITIQPILELLKETMNKERSILVIADDFSREAIDDLASNKIKAGLQVCAVKSPGYGEAKDNSLEDIAAVTGAKIISRKYGKEIEDVTIDDLGSATAVKVDSLSFSIINEDSSKEDIDSRIAELKNIMSTTADSHLKSQLEARVSKLSGGAAVLYVAGNSPIEIVEKKYRIEDAINATRGSLEEGIVPGGGVTLLKIGEKLRGSRKLENKDQDTGYEILINALSAPIITICDNVGTSSDIKVSEVLKNKTFNYGYDARNDKYGDMVKLGVIDPKKVTKTALLNASSVSQMILTMNTCIY